MRMPTEAELDKMIALTVIEGPPPSYRLIRLVQTHKLFKDLVVGLRKALTEADVPLNTVLRTALIIGIRIGLIYSAVLDGPETRKNPETSKVPDNSQ
jgi:hypothetical protein